MNKYILLTSPFVLSSFLPVNAVTLSPIDLGWYSETGLHFTDNTNYAVGDCRGNLGLCLKSQFDVGSEVRNFFVFDTSTISGTITNAMLKLEIPDLVGFSSPTDLEFYQLAELTVPITELGKSPRPDIFQSLGTGLKYSNELFITSSLLGETLNIKLNSNAIAELNKGNKIFGISGALASLNHNVDDEFIFGYTHPEYSLVSDSPVTLELTTKEITEPNYLYGILIFGLGMLSIKKT